MSRTHTHESIKYILNIWIGFVICGSSSNFIPSRIQQYNTVCMTNITNSRVIIDIVMWFCWWPPESHGLIRLAARPYVSLHPSFLTIFQEHLLNSHLTHYLYIKKVYSSNLCRVSTQLASNDTKILLDNILICLAVPFPSKLDAIENNHVHGTIPFNVGAPFANMV